MVFEEYKKILLLEATIKNIEWFGQDLIFFNILITFLINYLQNLVLSKF